MKKNLSKSMKKSLIELYLSIKKNYNNNIKENSEYLFKLDETTLIKYIKDSIDISISKLAEKKANEFISKESEKQDYESLLIKCEKDIRGHIRTEHQLKLYSDSLQTNIEEIEKEKNELNDIINIKNNEIKKMKKEMNFLKKNLENQKKNLDEIEKKLKNFAKIEKKYKNEIESLKKQVKYYEKLFFEDIENNENNENNEKGKVITNTIYCNSSRHPINNYLKNGKETKLYRNMNNNFISYNSSMVNSHPYPYPYVKKEKSITKKLNHNHNHNHNQIRTKNIYIPNNNNNSFIMDSRIKHQTINKLIINDSSLNEKKTKGIYHRHKSIENNSNKYIIRNKPLNIIKKILISNNNSNNNSFNNINKGFNHSYINFKNKMNSNNNAISMNSSNNNVNKSGLNCDFNANKMKDKNGVYIKTNIYKKSGNFSERELGYKKINNQYNSIHINGKKEIVINFRNKSKEKINSSYTTNDGFN